MTRTGPLPTRDQPVEIPVDGEPIAGTLVLPAPTLPAVLFVHGWGGSQEQYLGRARRIAALGCVCLAFDLRGHAATRDAHETVSREQNLQDVLAAYDTLAAQPGVDRSAIAVVGSSYGGYLAALLTGLRPVCWLALRVPALYKDQDWHTPKRRLDRAELDAYRRDRIRPAENRALAACAAFRGDVLLVQSEHDQTVPPPVIENYRDAFGGARTLAWRVLEGADHGLSDEASQRAYSELLVDWFAQRLRESSRPLPGGPGDHPGGPEPPRVLPAVGLPATAAGLTVMG